MKTKRSLICCLTDCRELQTLPRWNSPLSLTTQHQTWLYFVLFKQPLLVQVVKYVAFICSFCSFACNCEALKRWALSGVVAQHIINTQHQVTTLAVRQTAAVLDFPYILYGCPRGFTAGFEISLLENPFTSVYDSPGFWFHYTARNNTGVRSGGECVRQTLSRH